MDHLQSIHSPFAELYQNLEALSRYVKLKSDSWLKISGCFISPVGNQVIFNLFLDFVSAFEN